MSNKITPPPSKINDAAMPKFALYTPIKRLADILAGIFGCIITLPVLGVVKITYLAQKDKAPIIYKHTRIGKNGKEFQLYKFRTMVPDADEVLKELLKDPKNAKNWQEYQKLDNDPRITKLGKTLRKTSIDELPQMFNVLKGDMSLVGPRPLIPGELQKHGGDPKIYESIRPGMTGWWAVGGRSDTDYQKRLELEYHYVNNRGFILDCKCLAKTVGVVFKSTGAK